MSYTVKKLKTYIPNYKYKKSTEMKRSLHFQNMPKTKKIKIIKEGQDLNGREGKN